MSTNAEIKRAILKGVLEDNLDIPKSSGRRPRERHALTTPASVPPDVHRTRWSPVPLLIAGFLFASGAAFPRLAGDLGVVGSAVPDRSPVEKWQPIETMGLAQGMAVTERGGDARDTGHSRDEPTQGHASPEGLPAAGLLPTSQVAFADPVSENAPDRPRTSYEQMIDGGSIPVAALFGLKIGTIVIDPGHGGVDPGATGLNGVAEKDLTLDIARRLRDKLESYGGHRVLLTREGDVKVSLKDRVEFARKHTADLFISIHFNSLPVESDNLVETFFFGPQADQRILALAEKENAGSGYSVADFRRVIARISDTLKTQESRELATLLHRELYGNLKRENKRLSNAGIKTAPFVVLLGSDVPSVLAEVSCLSNEQEARNLETTEYRDRIAEYLKGGIVQYLDQQRKTQQNYIATGELNHVAKQQDR